MYKEKQQRYVVKASQGDSHYYFPHTNDKKIIEKNKEKAWNKCFIADFGKISGVEVKEPTDFYSVDNFLIYEDDVIAFQKDNFHQLCLVIKNGNLFYGMFENDEGIKQYILMDENYTYEFEYPDYPFDYDNSCSCCECCGCTCYLNDEY